MAELKPLLGLLTVSLALVMLGVGLGSFVSLGQALWGDSSSRARTRMEGHWWADVRLGAWHALVLLVVMFVSHNRPLLGLVAMALVGFAVTCLWIALPALVLRLGENIQGRASSRLRATFVGAFSVVWGCAIPYLGQALLLLLLLGAYGAGLATILNRKAKSPLSAATGSLDEYESLVSGISHLEHEKNAP